MKKPALHVLILPLLSWLDLFFHIVFSFVLGPVCFSLPVTLVAAGIFHPRLLEKQVSQRGKKSKTLLRVVPWIPAGLSGYCCDVLLNLSLHSLPILPIHIFCLTFPQAKRSHFLHMCFCCIILLYCEMILGHCWCPAGKLLFHHLSPVPINIYFNL